MPLWGFTDRVELRRRDAMTAAQDWETVRQIVTCSAPTWMGFEDRRDPLGVGGQGAKRASVRLAMSNDHADVVYNSPVGIRAQYCLGHGTRLNRELVDELVPNFIVELVGSSREMTDLSLRGVDSKLCLTKDDIPNLQEIHIDYGPWIACLGGGDWLAETGVLAPLVDAIWIKGAWILDGKEWRDPLKADRDEKFRKYGFG